MSLQCWIAAGAASPALSTAGPLIQAIFQAVLLPRPQQLHQDQLSWGRG